MGAALQTASAHAATSKTRPNVMLSNLPEILWMPLVKRTASVYVLRPQGAPLENASTFAASGV